ncbi:hypothetical protein [Pontibacter chitinilyticus]|uniref:hypothetical protein n=1 Tax=Pontibacter chitinilyticus TaxID=2674989 RepID=UPI00321C3080
MPVINLELENNDRAIDLLPTCVKLHDRVAAKLLKEQLQQKIAYADTMHYDDVDIKPKVVVNSAQEDFLVGTGINKAIEKPLLDGLKKSKVLRKEVAIGTILPFALYFGKDGKLNAEIMGGTISEAAQKELSSILQSLPTIIPGKHRGQEVLYGV